MTTKGRKSSATRKDKGPAKAKAAKPAARKATPAPAAKKSATPPARRPASPTTPRRSAPPGPVRAERPPVEPTLLERAERFRDDVQRSKMTHPDPWSYAAKARGWGERAQAIVDAIAHDGDTAAQRKALEALVAQVEDDSDFRAARALF